MSIQSEIQRLRTVKSQIGYAIETKGVSVPSTTALAQMPDLIKSIPTGGGFGAFRPVEPQEVPGHNIILLVIHYYDEIVDDYFNYCIMVRPESSRDVQILTFNDTSFPYGVDNSYGFFACLCRNLGFLQYFEYLVSGSDPFFQIQVVNDLVDVKDIFLYENGKIQAIEPWFVVDFYVMD